MASTTDATQPDLPWCQISEPHPVLVACYWLIHCIWIVNISLGAYGTYKICKMKDKMNMFAYFYFVLSFLWVISPPGFAFGFQSGWECWYNNFRAWEGTVMIGVTNYLYGLTVLYFFFLFRLKKVFDTTGLALNRIIMGILLLSGIAQSILPALVTYYFLLAWNTYARTWAVRLFNAHSVINISSLIIVLILFVKKILFLSDIQKNGPKQMTQQEQKSEKEDGQEQSVNGDHHDIENANKNEVDTVEIHKRMVEQEILSLAIRYMVCALFAMLSSAAVAFVGVLRSEIPGLHDNLPWRGVHITSYGLDECINLICLYLQFPFGKRIYGKCCYRFDKCVQSLFVKALNIKVSSKTVTKSKTKDTELSMTSGSAVQMEMSI